MTFIKTGSSTLLEVFKVTRRSSAAEPRFCLNDDDDSNSSKRRVPRDLDFLEINYQELDNIGTGSFVSTDTLMADTLDSMDGAEEGKKGKRNEMEGRKGSRKGKEGMGRGRE